MLVARIVVETLPGKARAVAERMEHLKGMGALSEDNDHRVVATWKVPESAARGPLRGPAGHEPGDHPCLPRLVGEEEES